jgi:sigma-B regulation protein RsbU (phosphoserine phosphatase)
LPDGPRVVALVIAFAAAFIVGIVAIVAYSVCIIVSLLRSYRESGVDEKRQLRWPLWGTLTAVGASIVLMAVSLVLSFAFGEIGHIDYTANVVLTALTKLVYLLIPISLAFGIVKYRLMEIDLIIRKTVVYSLVTGFVLVVYLVLAGVSGLALVRSAGLESQAATVVATLVVVALFVPVRNRIQGLVDRVFFRRERDTQASIRRVTEMTSQASSLDEMAMGVAEEVQRALHCRTVAILSRASAAEGLVAAATVGLPDRAAPRILMAAGDSVLSSGHIHVDLTGAKSSPEIEELVRVTRAERAVLCRRADETVALIAVGRKLDKTPFDDGDEVFLEAVSGQLVVGLGRLRGRRAELEFAQALEIQRSLLPAEIPQISGIEARARWQPAREVSGDYYDVLRLADDQLALCIGDVVGKGMPAALLMSSLQASVRAVATAGADPAAVCAQVRSVVTSNLSGGKFVTFFYAVLDVTERQLRFTNCGHNQPVLVRADGSVERLAEGGPAFARLMRSDGYASGELELRAGDRLVLFTDGVSEAADRQSEQFGEDRLEALVAEHRTASAPELEQLVASAVLDHANGELQDDLTLVVVAVG